MGGYIIRLNDSATEDNVKDALSKFEAAGGKVTHNHTLFKGFSGTLPEEKAHTLDSIPNVASIEKDGKVTIQ